MPLLMDAPEQPEKGLRLQQLADMMEAFITLGVRPPDDWLRAAEVASLVSMQVGCSRWEMRAVAVGGRACYQKSLALATGRLAVAAGGQ